MAETYKFTVCGKRGCRFSAAHEIGKGLSRDGRFAIFHCADGHETKMPVKWMRKVYPNAK